MNSRQKRQKLVDLYIEQNYPDLVHADKTSLEGLQLCERLSGLPFYCNNHTLHLDDPNYHQRFCCMTHVVGLPRHPATKEEMPLTPFQIKFINQIIAEITKLGPDASLSQILAKLLQKTRLANLFHINKGRQMGFTEIVLRLIQWLCFTRYAGSKVGIIAATNGKLAKKDLRRFYRLFKNIPQVVEHGIANSVMKLVNDTEIEAFAASEEAATGDTNYKCFFMDESAKWKLVDDSPVFNSILPIVRTNGADLFLVSTPKGPIKMFYKIHEDPDGFILMEFNILETIGNLYTKEEVDTMIASSKEDPDQEYMCKFKIGRDNILGAISDDDRADFVEWDSDDDEEDDGYDESEDDDWS